MAPRFFPHTRNAFRPAPSLVPYPHRHPHRFVTRLRAAVLGLGLGLALKAGSAPTLAAPVDFARDIRPLLNKHCTSCHGGVKRAGGVSFLSREGALAEAKSGNHAVVPADLERSALLRRITSAKDDERMPPPDHAPALPADAIRLLTEWIREGARWTRHWAYEPPVSRQPPSVRRMDWPRSDLDRFVLARLEAEGLQPSAEAPRRGWLRRASLDLTGLPPTEAEVEDFLSDRSSQAHERVVDRLLGSLTFGERWAATWLDLARYADTMGYERDYNRVAWPWRDWVVRAFNEGLPYDQFVLRQLAGDLLPGAGDDDRLATAFHRNTQTNTECGSDDEEFRLAAVIDRISTTWEGLAATSFRCVQCHNHPYDPFTHEEFYRFAALFNTTRDHDAGEDFPLIRVAESPEDRARLSALEQTRELLRRELHSEGMDLAARAPWKALEVARATSTGLATFTPRLSPEDQVPELLASGTLSINSTFSVDFQIVQPTPFGALRLQVLPDDESRAVSLPDPGFVLSHLQAELLPAAEATNGTPIPFVAAFDEDPDAFFPAEATLHPDPAGWSAYPRFHRRRTAVFVPGLHRVLPAGTTLRLRLAQNVQSSGISAQALRRTRFFLNGDSTWAALIEQQRPRRERVAALESERDAIRSVQVPVMAEQPVSQRRDTRVFLRGNWQDKGASVQPGVPALFGNAHVGNRLELARWLASADHPLFARVAVNRFWEQLFGLGIVESSEEFGTTGQAPSHPELLDWLALRFARDLEFKPKALLREIVLSATYRQDSAASPESLARDPRNRLLARGPRQRLSAEMVRDQALAIAGLLSLRMGGPPVMPLQPEGIWRTVYNGGKWITSPGEDAHRRALYTFIRRTSGYPSFQTFDAPSREFCTVRRLPTNTPLQALVTLNDPVYVEAAVGLARRMTTAGPGAPERIARGFSLAAGRPPTPRELAPLVALHETALQRYSTRPDAAAALAGSPELSSLTLVANAILNLDLVLTR